ncbi:MAG TPA: AmmeMemoRadiSam system protein B [Burkholderiales bacterium]|nr:AmmeMemoRadiSam system protein B [Burkholderiales bacterium]
MSAAANVRPAAVAGAFYPGNAPQLAAEISELLDGVERLEPKFGFPKALIVPHAGYIYSGPVAARAYDELVAARGVVRRVVLLGPTHYVAGRGLALPAADAFDTPLGRIPVDVQAAAALADLGQVVRSEPAHAQEHSLEVQLPFLQRMLGEFSLVPLATGAATKEEVAEVLERLWGGPETLIVISTDMSHYHAYDEAKRIDAATLQRIADLATDLNHDEACGATALNGFLELARRKSLSIRLLAACNSGDTAGGRTRVVGYSSFALYDGSEITAEAAGRTLLEIAKGAISNGLGLSSVPAKTNHAPWLLQPGASFVTLMKDGQLRGCIGSLSAARPLGQDVASNARAAAFQDPRFPKLKRDEWPRCDIEVSLLSAAKPMQFADETDLFAQISPGEDGLILEYGDQRATYLPQVWEVLSDKRQFLDELKKKAGIPADTRLARCRISRYRVKKFATKKSR